MRDRGNITHRPALPAAPDPRLGLWAHIRRGLHSVIGWFRAGYPDAAPATGYSPLLALYGPVGLTPAQLDCVAGEVPGLRADRTDIGVGITKATDRLPTESQIQAACRRVSGPGSP